jgi:capsular exopolysaccharide synthesis family protein
MQPLQPMNDDNRNKLIPAEEQPMSLDLRRDYRYGKAMSADSDETHLRDYWRIVRRRLWIPMSVMVVAVTLTTIYMLRLPSIYEGVSRLQIDNENTNSVSVKELQINMGNDWAYINTQMQNMQTPEVALIVAKTLRLDKNAAFMPIIGQPAKPQDDTLQIADDTQGEDSGDQQRYEPYVGMLLGNVDVKPVRDTRLVEIHYRHTSRDMARKIADTWADAFIKYNLDSRYKASKKSAAFLDERIADYKLKLRQASEAVLNYTRANNVIDFGEKENTVLARLSQLNSMLLQAENERKNFQMSNDLAKEVADKATLPEIQKDQIVQNLTTKLAELRQKKAQLEVEFTSEWPEVKQVDQQIDRVEGELRAAYARILKGIENQYVVAQQKENSLRHEFEKQRGETIQQNQGAITAKMLQQEVDTNREMLNSLLQSQKGVEVAEAGTTLRNNIRVTEYSGMPGAPVAPKRLQNILISLFLSLIGGIGLVLFLDYVNNKIESVEDVDRYLKLPALGVIPVFEGNKPRRLLGGGNGNGHTKELTVTNGMSPNTGSVILTQVESASAIAESYRQLRTALLLSSAGHAPRTLLVTSSQPAEGKTTTSINMAISLAQTGAAVVIVDADLRRPRVHRVFGLKNTFGLCNYLAGDCDLSSLIQAAMPNLYVLPVGPLPPNPAELLGSAKMKQAIDALSNNFDYVVIDSPPVASFADSLILSSMVDGVIIVVKGSATTREMAQRTSAHLHSVGAKILGVVVNQIKLQPHDYYYYSSYYSSHYYGKEGSTPDSETARSEGAST